MLGFFTNGVVWSLVSAAAGSSFNRLMKTSVGFVMVPTGVEDDTGKAVVAPLASALRVTDSGDKPDNGSDRFNFDFLLAGCKMISCQTVHTAYKSQWSFNYY